jgi:3-oxoacyl-[acyl-carrier protein] reductase
VEQRKSCLITGASRGIGAAVAVRMARRGYCVYINYRRSDREAASLVNAIRRAGGAAEAIAADVTDRDAVGAMFHRVGETHSTLDALVHNAAAPLEPARVLDLDWYRDAVPQLEVNALGFLNVIQAAGPLLAPGSRIIVLLTDALFHTPPVQMGAYLTAKGALWGLVRAAAKELRPRGVLVNTVSPSMVDTDLLRNYPERARGFRPGASPGPASHPR